MLAFGAPVTVYAKWIDERFFIWGEHRGFAIEAERLKRLLFAWHEPTYYGTFVDCVETEGKEGIAISAEDAVDFFAQPTWTESVEIRWGDTAQTVIEAASVIREALETARIVPDFQAWKAGSWGWKLRDGYRTDEAARCRALPFWDDWLRRVMENRTGGYRPALRLLERFKPGGEDGTADGDWPAELWASEEEWLRDIGWIPDETPFRVCLQLQEPDLDTSWSLRVALQDRNRPDRVIPCGPTGQPDETALPDDWRPHTGRIRPVIEKWMRLIPWLRDPAGHIRTRLGPAEAWDFLTDKSLLLAELGFTVLLPPWWHKLRRTKPKMKAQMRPTAGPLAESLFGLDQIIRFDWKLAIGDHELDEDEFRRLVDENVPLVRVRGDWVLLDAEALTQIRQLLRRVRRKNGLSFREVLAMELAESGAIEPDNGENERPEAALRMEIELHEHLRRFIRQLQRTQSIPLVDPPSSFHGTLRRYQVVGVSWLMFLRRFGLGACLADDMGLGKTIQWITYLLLVKERERPTAPALIICPTSVLGNWQKELERFAPSLNVRLHYGPNRKKGESFAASIEGCDLVLTSYALCHLDAEELGSVHWSSVCLDEAQNIKNAHTKQAAAVRKLSADHRIAMTGTPVENRLTELWSIFDFINPGYLGSLRDFTQRFAQAVERSREPDAVSQVRRLVQPFLLRRTKHDPAVELDLPDKIESKTYVPLTIEQAALYEQCVQDLFERLEKLKTMERRGAILAALTRLKQICDHPALVTKETSVAGAESRSGKTERLLEMVRELRRKGDRCLVFTQFVEMGRLLRHMLERDIGEPVLFLHGGTPKAERDRMIARFQGESADTREPCGIMILSLKAGGVGLNLTAANHVFHFDRWWNPAVENQATDRAYRIGQTKHVHVHKFVTLGTLEERIDEMIEQKLELSRRIVGSGEGWITELSASELRELFALRREWMAT